MEEDRVIKLLEEIKNALKAEEGYFIYTSTSYTTALENLLNEFGLKNRYVKSDTLMADLYEYIVFCSPELWQKLRDRITQSGFKAYCSNTRLPVSGTIGTINAIVEKAQVYGFDQTANDWEAIYQTSNQLWVRLKADEVGLLKKSDLDIDATTRDLGVKIDADNAGLAKEATLSALNNKFEAYNRTCNSLQVSVGTTASQISTSSIKARYVRLQAPSSNTDVVKVGGATNQFYELAAGKELELYDVDLSTIYVVSPTAGQVVNVIYVT